MCGSMEPESCRLERSRATTLLPSLLQVTRVQLQGDGLELSQEDRGFEGWRLLNPDLIEIKACLSVSMLKVADPTKENEAVKAKIATNVANSTSGV